jgi:hypothetical protein
MSGLTKKTVIADRTLSTILGVNEGELVSYAQLSKGLHKYIKDNDLRNLQLKEATPAASQPAEPVASQQAQLTAVPTAATKKCRDCAADIPANAAFCDLCSVKQ